MVIARLWGGMGNQLFQYAAGYALARVRGVELLLDDVQCRLDKNRPYELDQLNISGRPWTAGERKRIEFLIRLSRPVEDTTRGWTRWLKQGIAVPFSRYFSYAADRNAGFQPEIHDAGHNVYLAGTWADARYFSDYGGEIRHEFSFKEAPDDENRRMCDRISGTNAVCVHVRRGDYVQIADTSTRFGTCSLDYYREASAHILARVEDPTAFVFSDDPAWTAKYLRLPCETVYVTHNVGWRNAEDLRLMAACRHFIIANSTFSWWGAWLSPHLGKIVVAPQRWSIDTQTIGNPVMPGWVRF